jgi:hypothetical protein
MMIDNARYKILFALLAFVIAIFYSDLKSLLDYYGAFESQNSGARYVLFEKDIVKSWDGLINLPTRSNLLNRNLKIAIGLNTNVDLILSGTDLFRQLGKQSTQSAEAQNHHTIGNLGQFKECFKHYFQKGSAAERSFLYSKDFEQVLLASESLNKQVRFYKIWI